MGVIPFKLILLTICLFLWSTLMQGCMTHVLRFCSGFAGICYGAHIGERLFNLDNPIFDFIDTTGYYKTVSGWYGKAFVNPASGDEEQRPINEPGRRRLESMDLESTGTDHQKMFVIGSVLVLFSLSVAAHLAYRARSKRSSIYKGDGATIRV